MKYFILFIILLSCRKSNIQKIDEMFIDFDSSVIEGLVNPAPIGAKVENLNIDGDIRVAVIDNGVDYNHPFLQDKMSYIDQGNGPELEAYDFMASDKKPYPLNFTIKPFLLGAKKRVEKRIHGAKANPYKDFEIRNKKFIESLKKNIEQSSLKNKEIYKKFNNNSLTIPGSINLLLDFGKLDQELTKENLNFEDYRKLINEEFELKNLNLIEKIKKFEMKSKLKFKRRFFKLPWQTHILLGYPQLISEYAISSEVKISKKLQRLMNHNVNLIGFSLLNDFQKFINILEETIDQESTLNYLKDYTSYSLNQIGVNFCYFKEGAVLKGEVKRTNSITDLNGFLSKNLCSLNIYQRTITGLSYNYLRWRNPRRYTLNIIDAFNDTELNIKKDFFNPDLRKFRKSDYLIQFHKVCEHSELGDKKLSEFIQAYEFKSTGKLLTIDKFFDLTVKEICNEEALHRKDMSNKNLKFYNQFHPYIDTYGLDIKHGTHVAGLIASQDKRIKIVPLRVRTHQVSYSPNSYSLEKRDIVWNQIKNWLNDNKTLKEYALLKLTGNANNDLELLREELASKNELNKTNIDFLEEITKAIKWVGDKKIPLANISLGLAKKIENLSDQSKSNEIKVHLLFEFIKSRLRSAFKHSSETKFFVAAGNEEMVVDSKNNAIVPCDLSSGKYFVSKGLIEKQNVENIICIQSYNLKNDKFEKSKFSNLIETGTKRLFATGENQYSSVKQADLSFLYSQAKLKVKGRYTPEILNITNNYSSSIIPNLSQVITNDHVKNEVWAGNKSYAKLSGTSMASPNALGFFAKNYLDLSLDEFLLTNKLIPVKVGGKNHFYIPKKEIQHIFK